MPLAEELINDRTAAALMTAIEGATPQNPLVALRAARTALAALPLRSRADLLRDALLIDIPGDFATLAAVVRSARDGAAPFDGWLIWPVSTAIADRAVADGGRAAFDDAMGLLADLTGRLSAEFAIRALLRHDTGRALELISAWTTSPDAAVRRLASEGTRPYLPWATRVPQLTARPAATVWILDALYRTPIRQCDVRWPTTSTISAATTPTSWSAPHGAGLPPRRPTPPLWCATGYALWSNAGTRMRCSYSASGR